MATRALGTKIKKGEIAIGSLSTIGGIEITGETIDVTTLDSEGGYREFIAGFKDGGEVPIEGFYDPASTAQAAMQTSLDAGLPEPYTIEFPTTPKASWAFQGVVTSFKVGDAETDGTIAFASTIKVSGKPTLTVTGA